LGFVFEYDSVYAIFAILSNNNALAYASSLFMLGIDFYATTIKLFASYNRPIEAVCGLNLFKGWWGALALIKV